MAETQSPVSVRIKSDIKTDLEKYIEQNNCTQSEAINELIAEGIKSKAKGSLHDLKNVIERDYDIQNIIQMRAFLANKMWEAHDNNGITIIKRKELERIDEFIKSFSDLAHNSNMWSERLRNEGYTMFAEIIEESKQFL